MVVLETYRIEFKVVPKSTSNVESRLVAPPTERAVFKEASFWTSNVDARIVALDTFNVDNKVVGPPI